MSPELDRRKYELAGNAKERLKWRIFREFSVLPRESVVKEFGDEQVIDCALHLLLDREGQNPVIVNQSFDMDEFLAKQEGAKDGTE